MILSSTKTEMDGNSLRFIPGIGKIKLETTKFR